MKFFKNPINLIFLAILIGHSLIIYSLKLQLDLTLNEAERHLQMHSQKLNQLEHTTTHLTQKHNEAVMSLIRYFHKEHVR